MDTSKASTGERERAPVEEAMDSDTPSQPIEKKSRLGELHLAFAPEKEVVEEHPQKWQPELKEKIDTQTRMGWAAADRWCLRGLRGHATAFWGRTWRRMRSALLGTWFIRRR